MRLKDLCVNPLPRESRARVTGGGQYTFVDDPGSGATHVYWLSDSGTLTYIRTIQGMIA